MIIKKGNAALLVGTTALVGLAFSSQTQAADQHSLKSQLVTVRNAIRNDGVVGSSSQIVNYLLARPETFSGPYCQFTQTGGTHNQTCSIPNA